VVRVPDGFVGLHPAVEPEPGLREDEARVADIPTVDGGKGGPDATGATPPNFYSVTASGLIDAGGVPAVFAKYAFGVQR
jgi:hypothetical protein